MSSLASLHTLVQSLSKAEKRYFNMVCAIQAGDKVYFSLYQLLERKNTTPAQVLTAMNQKYPDAIIDAARKHLYRMLLKSLRNFEADKSVETRLMHRIQDIKILFNKGLMELCFAELERAKDLALKYEKFSFFLILARLELQYLTLLEFPDADENELIKKQEIINQVLHQELWLSRHSNLNEIILHRYLHDGQVRSQQELNKLDDLLLEEFQIVSNKHYHSILSQKLHQHFQSTYFLMTGNHKESLKLFYQLHHLFQQHPHLLLDSPIYYIYLLDGILTDLRFTRQYADMPFFIDSLQNISIASESLTFLIQHFVYQHQLILQLDQGEFEKAEELILKYKKEIGIKVKVTPPNSEATIYLLMALTYFGLSQYQVALQHVNNVLQISPKFISPQVYSLARMLRLIIQVELKNDDYLFYELRSVERKLKSEKKLFKLEKLTIHFLQKWIGSNRALKHLEYFYKQLKEIEADPYENQLLTWFNLLSWAEATITKNPYRQMVRLKSKELTVPALANMV